MKVWVFTLVLMLASMPYQIAQQDVGHGGSWSHGSRRSWLRERRDG
jgi:hypothetical protein